MKKNLLIAIVFLSQSLLASQKELANPNGDITLVTRISAPESESGLYEQKIRIPKKIISKIKGTGSAVECMTTVKDSQEPAWDSFPKPSKEDLDEWNEEYGKNGASALYMLALLFDKDGAVTLQTRILHISQMLNVTLLIGVAPLSFGMSSVLSREGYGDGPRLSISGIDRYKKQVGDSADESLKLMPEVVVVDSENRIDLKDKIFECMLFED